MDRKGPLPHTIWTPMSRTDEAIFMAKLFPLFVLAGVLTGVVAGSSPPNTTTANAGVVAIASPPPPAATSTCPKTSFPCGDGVGIRYPFWIDDKVSGCGYPSLRLECRGGTPVLPLPSGGYIVKSIDYGERTISVIDLAASKNTTCPIVAGRNLTLPAGSPPPLSLTEQDTNLTFVINCNFSFQAQIVPCLESVDGMRHTYLYREDDDVMPHSLASSCEDVVGMPVLWSSMSISTGSLDAVMPALARGFELQWRPAEGGECGDCERAGGWCGVEHEEEAEQAVFKCFIDSPSKYSVSAGLAVVIAFIVFGVFAALLALCCWIRKKRLQREGVETSQIEMPYIFSLGLPAIGGR